MDLKNIISTKRENNIRDCFANQHVDFQYANDIDKFKDLLDICQRKNQIVNKMYQRKIQCWIDLL